MEFFRYVDAPKEIACVGEIKQRSDIFNILEIKYNDSSDFFVGNRHILIVSTRVDIRPVDDDAIFWLYPSISCNSFDTLTQSINLFQIYMWLASNFDITDKTEIYFLHSSDKSVCHRLYWNKDIKRFVTKVITLKR